MQAKQVIDSDVQEGGGGVLMTCMAVVAYGRGRIWPWSHDHPRTPTMPRRSTSGFHRGRGLTIHAHSLQAGEQRLVVSTCAHHDALLAKERPRAATTATKTTRGGGGGGVRLTNANSRRGETHNEISWRGRRHALCLHHLRHRGTRSTTTTLENRNPIRTVVSFWGGTIYNLSGLSPTRDCSPAKV